MIILLIFVLVCNVKRNFCSFKTDNHSSLYLLSFSFAVFINHDINLDLSCYRL
jgi:hypothetical protein